MIEYSPGDIIFFPKYQLEMVVIEDRGDEFDARVLYDKYDCDTFQKASFDKIVIKHKTINPVNFEPKPTATGGEK